LKELTELLQNGNGRLGLDIGSRSTKAFQNEMELITDTPGFLEELRGIKISKDLDIVTTGYGRHRINGTRSIPEIRAHTTGVIKNLEISDCIVLDIGGQDFKVIKVEGKSIRDFTMNDKCAAGTGRFLEKMAQMLSMDLDELGSHVGDRKVLESTCSVFTETEIISMMIEGVPRDELASGVIHSVYERVRPYLKMFRSDTIVFTGGVAVMDGLRLTIEKNLDVQVIVPERSQFIGAIGCFHSRR
jgi:predicted CoA-substrate-specific enzyme activase